MSGRRSRTKGVRFELEMAHALEGIWPGAKRGIGQARSAKEVSDVEGTPFWIEAKHRKKCSIPAAFRQAREATDGRPILVITRENRGDTLVSMTLEDFIQWTQRTSASAAS